MRGDPIEGQVLVLAGATASVTPERLPDLIDEVQADLGERLSEYRRRYELACKTEEAAYFFVEEGHWETVGDRLGLGDRETGAVRRAHREQLLKTGRREGRGEEFEAALDLREGVVVGR
jgi:hypothetical protein